MGSSLAARPCLRPTSQGKKISTKGIHEEHEGKKSYPRRGTKDREGPLRGWRRLKRDPPKVGKGEKISTKRQKDIHEGPRRTAKGHEGVGGGSRGACQRSGRGSAKGLQGVGKDSKGVREGPRRKTLTRISQCAMERRLLLTGAKPVQQLSLRLVAARADHGGNDMV